jgi:hypothetical protein
MAWQVKRTIISLMFAVSLQPTHPNADHKNTSEPSDSNGNPNVGNGIKRLNPSARNHRGLHPTPRRTFVAALFA